MAQWQYPARAAYSAMTHKEVLVRDAAVCPHRPDTLRHPSSAPVCTQRRRVGRCSVTAAEARKLLSAPSQPSSRLHHGKTTRSTKLLASALTPEGAAASPRAPSAPPAARASAPILEPSRLVSALEKLAAAGHTPEPHWLDMFLAACQSVLPQLSMGQLAALARSLGRLRVEVPVQWVQALMQASYDALPSATHGGDVADLLTWLAVDGRLVPEPSWVGAALQQIQILLRSRRADLSASQAADTVWAVARMGYRPADPLLDVLAAATMGPYGFNGSSGRVGDDDGDGMIEGEAWGDEEGTRGPGRAGATAAAPPPLYSIGGVGAGESLATLPPEQLSRLAWAFASYNYFPSDQWVQLYMLEGIWRRGLSPEEATAVLWSLGALQLPAEDMWLRNYYLMTTGRLREVPPEGLVNAIWALAACREVERAAPLGQRRQQQQQQQQPLWEPGESRGPPSAASAAALDSPAKGETATVRHVGKAAAAAAAKTENTGGAAISGNGGHGGSGGGGDLGGGAGIDEVAEMDEDLETQGLVATLMEGQLAALSRLRSSGSPQQRQALAQLEEALRRRLAREGQHDTSGGGAEESAAGSGGGSGRGGSGGDDSDGAVADGSGGGGRHSADGSGNSGGEDDVEAYLPAAWVAEWYDVTRPYIRHFDKTLLVKALWALACLDLRPPPAWLRELAAAASTVLLAEGVAEPLELLYGSRSADALLLARRRRAPPPIWVDEEPAGASDSVVGEGEEEEEAREALARFAARSFQRLSRQQLPVAWRRLNPRFPPYAQPRPGATEPGGQGAAGNGVGTGASSGGEGERTAGPTALGPAASGPGLLRPFR